MIKINKVDLQAIIEAELPVNVNIVSENPISTVYKMVNKYKCLNVCCVDDESREYLEKLGVWEVLSEYGLSSDELDSKHFMDTKWFFIIRTYTNWNNLKEEIDNFCESNDLTSKYPDFIYIETLSSWNRKVEIKEEIDNSLGNNNIVII